MSLFLFMMSLERSNFLIYEILIKYISYKFFNKDRFRAISFMQDKNSNFNGKIPKELILGGEADIVWSFVQSREYDNAEID
jgi:hypothetical protein